MTPVPFTSSNDLVSPSGVVHRQSPYSVNETLDRLSEAIEAAGAKLFAVIDQSAEAEGVEMRLRDTVLAIFGSPIVGTQVMEAAPLSALDLPLKILIWVDDHDDVWMSFLSGHWLRDRYQLGPEQVDALMAPQTLAEHIATQ